ncbi:hypothetical protein FBU31_001033 [Coemansia sp. 'formosensis']|nr:hypothetical protein FBU31_001033 [Coemansia sp. 'formosensis']
MDIDDDNSSVGTLNNEGQNIAASNSTTSTHHTLVLNTSQAATIVEETASTSRRTITVSEDGSEPLSSQPSDEPSPYHMTLSYSPSGMATSWTMTGHTAPPVSYIPTTVHSLLPDAHGICHYHRPHITPSRGGMRGMPRSLIMRGMELRHRDSMLTRNMEFGQRESMVRLEASQRALDQVMRSLASTRRCMIPPEYGRERHALDCSSAVIASASIGDNGDSPMLTPIDSPEWVSDTEETNEDGGDTLTYDAYDLLMRIKMRSATRRANNGGISKSTGIGPHRSRRGRHVMHAESLSTAYSRFKNDEQKIRDSVTAMGQGDSDDIAAMLRQGVSVNITDHAGRTPLHVACSCGNLDAVRLLIHMGASVNATDRIGNTPLTIAATGARTNIILPLLEGGADPRIGQGLVSAMGMVRSRLRLLRNQIRHARSVEQVAANSFADILPRIKERRMHSVNVAKECVETIRLLREYTRRHTMTESQGDPMRVIYKPASEATGSLADVDASELDSLSEQLLSMEIAGPQNEMGKILDPLSLADNDVQEQESNGSESEAAQDEDRQIEDLLEKFSMLLGDTDDAAKDGD